MYTSSYDQPRRRMTNQNNIANAFFTTLLFHSTPSSSNMRVGTSNQTSRPLATRRDPISHGRWTRGSPSPFARGAPSVPPNLRYFNDDDDHHHHCGICTRRVGKLYRARSWLYRSQNLQANTHVKALADIYTMHSFAPFSNLNFFFKNRQQIFAIE